MKIVFLDFDGVLTTRRTLFQRGDIDAVAALNEITKRTGAEIVISSTWRYYGLQKCMRFLTSWGVLGSVRGMTMDFRASRGEEIAEWIDAYKDMGIAIDRFVVLDDDSDIAPFQAQHVKTDTEIGLTMVHAEKAIRILND